MSVKSWLSRCILMLMTLKERDIHLNEHGKIVMMNIVSGWYTIGPFLMCICNAPKFRVHFRGSLTEEPLPSQINRWSSSLTLRMDNLCNAYDAIKHIVWRPKFWPFCSQNQPYAPGSVLTSRGRTLVGRVPIKLDEWVVKWGAWVGGTTILLFPSTESTRKSVFPLIVYLLANCSLAVVQ